MTIYDRLALLSAFDAFAVALTLICWPLIGWWIERPSTTKPSVTVLMLQFRRDWMRELVTREPRIFDASILASLRHSTSFFTSTCVIAIGGVIALMGNAERLAGAAENITQVEIPILVWELKLGFVALFLTNAALKFIWSNRLFGYCAVVMAAVPNDVDDPRTYPRAAQAAELNIRAACNFNRGLRAMYLALNALAWLLGPLALLLATLATLWLLWSREFRSISRNVLLDSHCGDPPPATSTPPN